MAGSKSHLIQNAREMVVSSDLTRIGQLAAREQQNADMARAVRADFYNPLTGTADDFGGTHRASAYEVIPSALVAPSLDPIGASFNMTLGAGETECITSDTSNPDVSAYQVARWAQQTVVWPGGANPDSSLPKIATIYATPSDQQSDEASRNILLDPVTRTYEPQNVYKTSNPTATIGVVGGTPAAIPLPPAIPANSIALFDLYMPAGSTQSSAWFITRRAWRRIEFPGTSQHGIVKGCVPNWAYAAEAAGAAPYLPSSPIHRLVIDGELLTFPGVGLFLPKPDTANNPGGSSAPATNDMPTYLYLCGGRHWPCSGLAFTINQSIPVMLVESLTAPDVMGYPSAALAIAAGSGTSTIPRNAALFIGVAFRVAGSTRSKSLFYDGDWVRPQAHTPPQYLLAPPPGGCTVQGFYAAQITTLGTPSTTPASLQILGIPATATALEIQADGQCYQSLDQVFVVNSCSGGPQILSLPVYHSMVAPTQSAKAIIARPASDTIEYAGANTAVTTNFILNIRATGFNMNIPRLST